MFNSESFFTQYLTSEYINSIGLIILQLIPKLHSFPIEHFAALSYSTNTHHSCDLFDFFSVHVIKILRNNIRELRRYLKLSPQKSHKDYLISYGYFFCTKLSHRHVLKRMKIKKARIGFRMYAFVLFKSLSWGTFNL